MPVYFHTEDIRFQLKSKRKIESWIKRVIQSRKKKVGTINYIFCSDEYLLGINRQYLKHSTYTDIITFDNSDLKEKIEGDIFISVERAKDNAEKLDVLFENELHRVMVHGVLHLLGYKDKKPADRKLMRKKEEEFLRML